MPKERSLLEYKKTRHCTVLAKLATQKDARWCRAVWNLLVATLTIQWNYNQFCYQIRKCNNSSWLVVQELPSLSLSLSLCLSLCLSVCLSVSLSLSVSLFLSVSLSVERQVHLTSATTIKCIWLIHDLLFNSLCIYEWQQLWKIGYDCHLHRRYALSFTLQWIEKLWEVPFDKTQHATKKKSALKLRVSVELF